MILLQGVSVAQVRKPAPAADVYQQGTESFKSRRYEQAVKILAPLTREDADPEYSPYAHYYYALSCFHLKKYNESVSMLKQLQNRYPSWKKDDVNYLMGANNLAAGYTLKGVEFLNKVGSKSFTRDIEGLKQQFVSKITNPDELKKLQKQYPQDRIVAECLVLLISRSSSPNEADAELAATLARRFDIGQQAPDNSRKARETAAEATKKDPEKDGISVSLLLPFRLQEFSAANRSRSNQFAYDYYQGAQIAAARLQSEGVKLNLRAYDVSNEEDLMSDLTRNPVFQQSDLIIGPLYPKSIEVARRFSEKNKILMVNPLSTDGSLLEGTRYLFLTHPSVETQMKQVLQVARDLSPNPSALIFYGNTSKDSLMAAIYETELVQKGGRVIDKVRFNNITDTLSARIPVAAPAGKPTHIVLFSSDPRSGPSLMSGLSERHLSDIPVIATSISFDFHRAKPSHYGKRLYLIESEDLDLHKASVVDFQLRYWTASNTLPSIYAVQGYDHLIFFIRMMIKYGRDPVMGVTLRRYAEDELLLAGFDFTNSRDNQLNAILKYDGEWVRY